MNVLHIAGRELRSTFSTAVGWLVLCGFLLLIGVFWTVGVQMYITESANLVYNPYGAATMTVNNYLLAPFFENNVLFLLMVIPAISMRLFSEELRGRTMELLLTSPVSTLEIVLGKFLGGLGFIGVVVACTIYAPLSLELWTTIEWGVIASGYLGVMLLSGAILAMGMLCSALTSNQIVAFMLSFSAALALYVVGWLDDAPDSWAGQLSVGNHLADLLRGAIRLSDITYYLAFTAFFIFATHQRVETWRVR